MSLRVAVCGTAAGDVVEAALPGLLAFFETELEKEVAVTKINASQVMVSGGARDLGSPVFQEAAKSLQQQMESYHRRLVPGSSPDAFVLLFALSTLPAEHAVQCVPVGRYPLVVVLGDAPPGGSGGPDQSAEYIYLGAPSDTATKAPTGGGGSFSSVFKGIAGGGGAPSAHHEQLREAVQNSVRGRLRRAMSERQAAVEALSTHLPTPAQMADLKRTDEPLNTATGDALEEVVDLKTDGPALLDARQYIAGLKYQADATRLLFEQDEALRKARELRERMEADAKRKEEESAASAAAAAARDAELAAQEAERAAAALRKKAAEDAEHERERTVKEEQQRRAAQVLYGFTFQLRAAKWKQAVVVLQALARQVPIRGAYVRKRDAERERVATIEKKELEVKMKVNKRVSRSGFISTAPGGGE